MRHLLQRMVSGPLDEKRLDLVLKELAQYSKYTGGDKNMLITKESLKQVRMHMPRSHPLIPDRCTRPAHMYTPKLLREISRTQWMMSTYLDFLKDPSLVVDTLEAYPDHVYSQ